MNGHPAGPAAGAGASPRGASEPPCGGAAGSARPAPAFSELLVAALLYVALTMLMVYPLSVRPATTTLPLGPDGELLMWLLSWDTHALVHQPWAVFEANTFYPLAHTLAFTENLIGSSLFAAPVLWISANPALALNLVSLLTCALCGLGAYVLARRLGITHAGALLAGIVFAFAPPRFLRLGQLHLAAVQWIPFGLASLHAYLDGGRRRDLRLAAGCFSLQALSSGHGMVFLAIAAGCLVLYDVVMGRRVAIDQWFRDLGVPGALLLLPTAVVFVQYLLVQQQVGLRRTLEHWAVTPESFLAAPTHVQTWLLSATHRLDVLTAADAFLFPGYLSVLLAIAALAPAARRRMDPRPSDPDRWWRLLAAVLSVAIVCLFVLAIALTLHGATRLRVGSVTVFSARSAWRPWLFVIAAAALRALLARRVPVAVVARLRRGAASVARRWSQRRPSPRLFYAGLTALSVWLSIGPPLSLWPLVYWLPGFNFIRVPSRFTMLAALGLAVLAGMGFDRLASPTASRRRALAAALVGLLLVVEYAVMPLAVEPYVFEIPAIDRWLDGQPKPFAIAEAPSPRPTNAGPFERRQTAYMLHSTAHWQRTVHGYGGILPPSQARLYEALAGFPDETSLQSLARIGVTYIVVHTDAYGAGEWPAIEARLARAGSRLRLEHVDGPGRVYSLHVPATQ